MTAAQAGAAVSADGIDFIYKYYAGRIAFGLVEKITHA
jgi:hypothetical protein